MQHRWYFSKEFNEIYNRNQQRIQKYFIQSINNNKYEINEDSKERCDKILNDAIPITHHVNQTFQVYTKFSLQNPAQKNSNEFNKYIKLLSIWKQVLIKNYKEYFNAEPLIKPIQQYHKLIIASDSSESSKTSGGGWVIADAEGSKLLTGFNPDFGDINQINSHRAEIYETFSIFLFLHEYCKFYILQLQSPI